MAEVAFGPEKEKISVISFMAAKAILSENQRKLLEIISREKKLCGFFYLTGGGAQFLQAEAAKDYPRMVKKISHNEWQKFFINATGRMRNEILE